MPAYALLALIALITGPNSTRLCLMQFMSVTRAIPFALTVMLLILHRIFLHFSIRGRGVNELSNKDTQSKKARSYSAPNKESTFSEILISAVKSTFSHSNHHKSIKELFWISFLKICFSPYITHREAIEVQKQFLGKL